MYRQIHTCPKLRDFENLRITIREVADDAGISFGSCQTFFTDVLGMLNFEQKLRRMNIAQEMLTKFNDDPDLLKKVPTDVESSTKAQTSRRVKTEKSTLYSVKC